MAAETGDIRIAAQSVQIDRNARTAKFTIDFGSAPDFLTVDGVGRQADSFQYYIDLDGELPVFEQTSQLEILIRVEEIPGTNQIVVLDDEGDGGTNSGGWGPIRGVVPFTVTGSILSFTVPFDLLGDSDGQFSYNLQLAEFGGMVAYLADQLSTSNVINGTNQKDNLIGTLAPDEMNGLNGQDTLSGLGGDDKLSGGNGDDDLMGGDGRDILGGGNGDDILIGSGNNSLNTFAPEVDRLVGGRGKDTFVLGIATGVFYGEPTGDIGVSNYASYAAIADFQAGDVIQLKGSAKNYQLIQNLKIDGRVGTAIIIEGSRFSPPNLIGLVEGVSALSLTSSQFHYV